MAIDEYRQLSFDAGRVFTPGSPINERELFAGRLPQVRRILDTISQRGYHGVLYGERGVGKTSLANVLAPFVSDTVSDYLFARVNCDASDTFSSIWRKAFQDVVLTTRKPGFGFAAADVVTHRSLVDSLPEEIAPNDVRRVLDDLGKGIVLVFVFDEFDRLTDKKVTAMMADTIKGLSDYGTPATILLIGVADSVDDLIEEHQSIERALNQINMQRMSDEEITQIVVNGIARLTMTIDTSARDEIVSLSQGLPYITHLLSLHVIRAALAAQTKSVELTHVQRGIADSLEQWQQSTKTSYYLATKSQQPDTIYREVLLACALAERDDLGYFSAASVRKPLRIIAGKAYDIPNFAAHLKHFSEAQRGNVLQRVGEKRRIRYRFTSPILCPYILMKGFNDDLLDKDKLEAIKQA